MVVVGPAPWAKTVVVRKEKAPLNYVNMSVFTCLGSGDPSRTIVSTYAFAFTDELAAVTVAVTFGPAAISVTVAVTLDPAAVAVTVCRNSSVTVVDLSSSSSS